MWNVINLKDSLVKEGFSLPIKFYKEQYLASILPAYKTARFKLWLAESNFNKVSIPTLQRKGSSISPLDHLIFFNSKIDEGSDQS